MARNYAAEYAARKTRALAGGWSSYGRKRRAMAEAEQYAPGRSREAVARREAIAEANRDYEAGSMTRGEIEEEWFANFPEEFFETDEWFDILSELSPEA